MAFNLIKMIGDDTTKTAVSNGLAEESVIHGLVAYNSTAGDLDFSLLLEGVVVVTETVSANSSFRIVDKINVPANSIISTTAATGLDLSISFYKQSTDTAADVTTTQGLVSDAAAEVVLATAQAAIATTKAGLASDSATAAAQSATAAATFDPSSYIATADIGTTVLSPTGDGSQLTGIETSSASISTPTITSPITGATDTAVAITVTGSAYATPITFVGEHTSSVLELATDSTFANIVDTVTVGLESLTAGALGASTQYFARLRYISGSIVQNGLNQYHSLLWMQVFQLQLLQALQMVLQI
jgi:hypothetical protein